ncbi:LysR family transcriptional regulator [Ensifer sp. T173]|jgi:DNA-binding transcriptional LysR family regulator|uniref:LysR family transcriptional regulator n=1 Tax=Ensifer canadensis TaxID=555315 RepID=A0AAW4FS77_9HYPH|nr:LysR family transcriptional regulator [Ensifer canadensis]MBM3094133.1 LysR family transcriptional regulator [Ensifer canadensis]UBI78231.1 LysR family transcriptional regulator [Ensifer canadensis]
MRFDLIDLRLFLAVVEAGSITHGAGVANLSLAAASERLRGMEDKGGVQLLARGRRGVTTTAAGEALAHHARLVLRQMEHLHGELGEYARGLRASIRLLANTAAITEFLPDRLGRWLEVHPQTDIDLKERQSSDIVKAVSGGLAEIGIISDAVDATGLRLIPFAIDRLVAVVAKNHPLAEARQIGFTDLLDHAFTGLAEGSALQDHIEGQAARIGRRISYRLRVRSFEDVCRLAAQDVGVGIVPQTAARRCRRTTAISALRLTDKWATRRLSICLRPNEDLSPLARDLVEHLGNFKPD